MTKNIPRNILFHLLTDTRNAIMSSKSFTHNTLRTERAWDALPKDVNSSAYDHPMDSMPDSIPQGATWQLGSYRLIQRPVNQIRAIGQLSETPRAPLY